MKQSKTILAAAAIAAIAMLGATSAFASSNLLTNGSFENGLTGWSITGTESQGYPPVVIDGSASAYPTGAFYEGIPVDNAASLSPDAAGNHSLYFVSDFSDGQVVSQSFTVKTAGLYNFGFDVYTPHNGLQNPYDAAFGVLIGNDGGAALVSQFPASTWTNFSGQEYLKTGVYSAAFGFYTDGFPSKDILVDRVYVNSAVPEPATWAVMLGGFGAIGASIRASRRKPARAVTA